MTSKRSETITRSGWAFILTNFGLAILNAIVGLIANSVAIVSDAVHSLSDSVAGFLVIISEKLATSKKFAEKRRQIERITTILIALIIVGMGVHIIVESIEKIFEAEAPEYSVATIVILIISILAKYALAVYLKKAGEKVKSDVLVASGAETMNDTWISVAVLVSAVVFLIWRVNIEAYVSLAIAVVIIKVGLEFIFPHISHHHHHHLESDSEHGISKKN